MKLTITVTKEDVAQGKPCAPRHCPIALATLRALPEPVSFSVLNRDLYITGKGTVPLPPKAREFVRDFDLIPNHVSMGGGMVAFLDKWEKRLPFTFTLEKE